MRKLTLPVIALYMLALFALTACGGQPEPAAPVTETESIDVAEPTASEAPAPETSRERWEYGFSAETLDGTAVTENDFLENKLTVLNVWATWCPPCVAELPALDEVSRYYADSGVEIVGVLQDGVTDAGDRDEDVIEAAKTLLENAGAEYTVILPDDALTHMFIDDMQFFPTTYILGESGEVLDVVIGSDDADGWKGKIDEVLQRAGG